VLPFYTSKTTRPSPTLNRDAPSVIRARIQTVTLACIVSTAAALYLLLAVAHTSPLQALHTLGWWPIRPLDVLRPLLLTALLFLGPLFELIFVDRLPTKSHLTSTLASWQGYRNYIAGPITEEILFRSVLVAINIVARLSPSHIVFLTPLYFGIAHIHHFYEFTLTHPDTPLVPALLRSLFQFTYTTLFGWFASFVFVRTGSLYACVIIHAFCNSMGLPRLWGRLRRVEEYAPAPVAIRGKDDEDRVVAGGRGGQLGVGWTVAYYSLLIVGVVAFYKGLWPLTASGEALVKFEHEN
jgi:prenyl protein peptidase